MSEDVITRFWQRIEQKPSGCWEWTGARDRGYGRLVIARKMHRAHRLAYELVHGPIPDGLVVMHACDNPPCCNPNHLSVGTPLDNTRDMIAKQRGRRVSGDLCPSGLHPMTPDNLASGRARRCLPCKRDINRRSYWNTKNHKTSEAAPVTG